MKKIAILNDIHGNYLLLSKVLSILDNEFITDYIFCGDNITDCFDNNLVLNKIKTISNYVIKGNREESLLKYPTKFKNNERYKNMLYAYNNLTKDNIKYIKSLPSYKIIKIANKKICISHGSPYNNRELVNSNMTNLFDQLLIDFDCDVYLFAHTHKFFYKEYRGAYFINSGAINRPNHGKPESTFGILTINDNKVTYEQKKYKYDFEELKTYYLNSDYYKECFEWTNLVLSNLLYGTDFISEFNNNLDINLSYRENFNKYMKEKNLEIY